jgi:hypothetical protein
LEFRSRWTLFSIHDVRLLAYFTAFVQSLPESVVLACKNLINSARDPDFGVDALGASSRRRTRSSRAVAALDKFIGVAPARRDEPQRFTEFVKFHRECARRERDFHSQSVLGTSRRSELDALIGATHDRRGQARSTVAQNDALLTEISALSDELIALCGRWRSRGRSSIRSSCSSFSQRTPM